MAFTTAQRRLMHRSGMDTSSMSRLLDSLGDDLGVRPETRGLDIREFVSGLTPENFEEAFRAALTHAYENTTAFANGGWGYDLIVPAGQWPFSRKVQFPGYAGYDKMTPGIRGAGSLRTTFTFPYNINDTCFEFGNADGSPGYCWFQTLEGFSVSPTPGGLGSGVGIASCVGYHQTFRDVTVGGWGANQHYESGTGFKITGSAWGNAQHLYMERCLSSQNQVGYFFDNVWQSTLVDLNANQNFWLDAVVDRCIGFGWFGGNLQSSSQAAWKNQFWHGGAMTPCITSGWGSTTDGSNTALVSGLGAVLQTAVRDGADFGLSHVTGLSGLTAEDRYRFLVLTDPAHPAVDLVSGIYVIEVVISTTECIISKGTAHAPKSGLIWAVRSANGANAVQITGYPYHEGVKRALLYAGPDHHGASTYSVRGALCANLPVAVEAHGVLGQVSAHELSQMGPLAVKATGTQNVETDRVRTAVNVDSFSHEGLICRQNGGLYQGGLSTANRLRSFCQERALAAWDARTGVTKSGTDVTAWTDFINGCQMVPKASGHYPQHTPSDANFNGRPSIKNVAGASNGGLLVGKIPGSLVTSDLDGLTVFAVQRIPLGGVTYPSTLRWTWAALEAGTTPPSAASSGARCVMGLFDNTYGAQIWGGLWSDAGFVSGGSIPADASTHAFMVSSASRTAGYVAHETNDGSLPSASAVWPAGSSIYVGVGDGFYGTAASDLEYAFVAVFPRGLGLSERAQLLDLAATEFNLPGR